MKSWQEIETDRIVAEAVANRLKIRVEERKRERAENQKRIDKQNAWADVKWAKVK